MIHLYLQAEIDEVDYTTTGVESPPIIESKEEVLNFIFLNICNKQFNI
jgi:hypothetical protein